MYSTCNDGKPAVVEWFIKTMKNKIFKHMAAISKNVYFDVLDYIVNKYNNTVHETIKMKPIDVTDDSYAEYNENSNKNILNLKLVTILEFQNIKTFSLKDMLQIDRKKKFLLVNLKIQFLGLMLFVTWMGKKLLEVFTKKNCKKLVKKNLGWKKYLKEKTLNYMLNGKGMIIALIVRLIKTISCKNGSILS